MSFKTLKKLKEKGEKVQKQNPMALALICGSYTLQFDCNPNIFPDAFKAEILFDVKDDKGTKLQGAKRRAGNTIIAVVMSFHGERSDE